MFTLHPKKLGLIVMQCIEQNYADDEMQKIKKKFIKKKKKINWNFNEPYMIEPKKVHTAVAKTTYLHFIIIFYLFIFFLLLVRYV